MLSRRGEYTAWLLTFAVVLTWVVLLVRLGSSSLLVPVLAVLLFLSAASISLGNWMDRRTCLILDETGVAFRNGLRDVQIEWPEITRIEVYLGSWGDKVHVLAADRHFSFRTLGEVSVRGEVKGRLGFTDGARILQAILDRAGLRHRESTDQRRSYVRQ